MEYRLVITEHAEELLDNLIYYLLYKLKNEQAAKHLLNGVENVYERMETNHSNLQSAGTVIWQVRTIERH